MILVLACIVTYAALGFATYWTLVRWLINERQAKIGEMDAKMLSVLWPVACVTVIVAMTYGAFTGIRSAIRQFKNRG